MQTERYNYLWVKKKSGYYQSTTNFPDGKRHWLHQEIYLKEVGELKVGYSVHHKDEDKDHNVASNFHLISNTDHQVKHMVSPYRRKIASEHLKNNNKVLQRLALKARKGEYMGVSRTRKLMKGKKHRVCSWCGSSFTLKETDRNDTKCCCADCSQKNDKRNRIPGYSPLAKELVCPICSKKFSPVSGNQFCCSGACCAKSTELKRKQNIQPRICIRCGGTFDCVKSSKAKYCSVACRNDK